MSWLILSINPSNGEVELKSPLGEIVKTTIPDTHNTVEMKQAHLEAVIAAHIPKAVDIQRGSKLTLVLSIIIVILMTYIVYIHV